MRIWIDLTKSPHVLVLRPVIETLTARGHDVEVTARDFAQTLELCERFGIAHTAIGRHRGGSRPTWSSPTRSRPRAFIDTARAARSAPIRGSRRSTTCATRTRRLDPPRLGLDPQDPIAVVRDPAALAGLLIGDPSASSRAVQLA